MEEFKIRCSSINRIVASPKETTIYSIGGKEITTAKYNKIVDSVLLSGDISLIQHVEIKKKYPKTDCRKELKHTAKNGLMNMFLVVLITRKTNTLTKD